MLHYVAALDISGSMFGWDIQDRVQDEVMDLFRKHGPLTVVEFSWNVSLVYTSMDGLLKPIKPNGGTDFRPLLDKLFEIHALKPIDTAIILTDGIGRNEHWLDEIWPFGLAIIDPWKVKW